ncbi:MAG: ABC transporter substrate-binding protein [Nitrososphaerales archaeon]
MHENPKKLDRRKFLYAGLGAAIVVVGGLAAYFATRPPERIVETVEKPVEKTVVQTQIQTQTLIQTQTIERPVEKTIVTTVAGTPTTIVQRETLTQTIEKTIEKIGGTVIIHQSDNADTLDPAVAWSVQAGEGAQQVYQGLVATKYGSSDIVPLLAESWKVSSDGLTWNFKIREGIKFSNGDPLNAYVFWYSIYRAAIMGKSPGWLVTVAIDPKGVTDEMLNMFNTPNNIPPPELKKIMNDPKLALTVKGDYELEFHLNKPLGYFLMLLTQPSFFAVSPRVVSEHGGVKKKEINSWMVKNAIGTGPFIVKEHEPRVRTVFERNPNYWGGANGVQPTPKVDRVIVEVVPDSLVRFTNLEKGTAHLTFLDYDLINQLVGKPGIYIPNVGFLMTIHTVSLTTAKPPFNNKLVRKAISYAIDYDAISKLYAGFAEPFAGPVPKGVLGNNPRLEPYKYDPVKAKELLAQAGYPEGKGIGELTLLYSPERPPLSKVAPVIQRNLADIGIKVKLLEMPTGQRASLQGSIPPTDPKYPELILQTWTWFPDPWAFADWFVGPLDYGPSNSAHYKNPEVDELLTKAEVTIDPEERAKIYKRISEIVMDDTPYIWYAQFKNAFSFGPLVMSVKVTGLQANVAFWQLDYSILRLVD